MYTPQPREYAHRLENLMHRPAPPDLDPPQPNRWPGICWFCGRQCAPRVNHGPTYCSRCPSEPWMTCTSCGRVKKRNRPNVHTYTCTTCKEHTP